MLSNKLEVTHVWGTAGSSALTLKLEIMTLPQPENHKYLLAICAYWANE